MPRSPERLSCILLGPGLMPATVAPRLSPRSLLIVSALVASALVLSERPAAAAKSAAQCTAKKTTTGRGRNQTGVRKKTATNPSKKRTSTRKTGSRKTKRKKQGWFGKRRAVAKARKTRLRNKMLKSMSRHEKVAMRLAETRMLKEFGRDYEMTSITKFPGDAQNPITGDGLYILTVRDKNASGVLGALKGVSKATERQVFVQVDAAKVDGLDAKVDVDGADFEVIEGLAELAGSGAHSGFYRAAKNFNERVPVRELASDFVKSRGKWNGIAKLVGAGGVALLAPGNLKAAGLVVVPDGLTKVREGVGRRSAAREEAFSQTIKDIRKSLKDEPGKRWTLAEAYNHYKTTLENTNSATLSGKGTSPMDMMMFATRLNGANL